MHRYRDEDACEETWLAAGPGAAQTDEKRKQIDRKCGERVRIGHVLIVCSLLPPCTRTNPKISTVQRTSSRQLLLSAFGVNVESIALCTDDLMQRIKINGYVILHLGFCGRTECRRRTITQDTRNTPPPQIRLSALFYPHDRPPASNLETQVLSRSMLKTQKLFLVTSFSDKSPESI
ncbi:hypothetical protein BOTBODRAFT_536809 [Botryobasidium botryosum FD-172 SS1]|uniref:Uncharacterized protein n=1 Tax=Botryobasidium botryosum (strain FD-172 SS1) TaxID=930990 RepID=A0A067MB78_BOTB1|nr:hypothetical protein BOTBODRAFT_536809 [Botryobasidium botryosum FD-172 SS1]